MNDTADHSCNIPGCLAPHYAKDWCKRHYTRAARHEGDPLGGRTSDGEAAAYFLAHADDITNDCITWPYSTYGNGYGYFWLDDHHQSVHVLACERHYGPRPQGLLALHAPVICHNRLCFNWRHLSWRTPSDNNADMILDETNSIGERHGQARLTWEIVNEARSRYAAGDITHRELAEEYGVSRDAITAAISGRTWST